MKKLNVVLGVAVVAILAALASTAVAEVRVCGTDKHGGGDHGFMYVCITGAISNSDVASFRRIAALADSYSSVTTISLDSEGGSVAAAIEIGRIIREKWFWTDVDEHGEKCYSACVLVLAAGAIRIAGPDSVVGIHRPYFEPELFAGLTREEAQAKYAQLSELEKSYLSAMGMPDQLYSAMMAVPSGSIRRLSGEEMTSFSLVGRDPAYDEWLAARRATRSQGSAPQRVDH